MVIASTVTGKRVHLTPALPENAISFFAYFLAKRPKAPFRDLLNWHSQVEMSIKILMNLPKGPLLTSTVTGTRIQPTPSVTGKLNTNQSLS